MTKKWYPTSSAATLEFTADNEQLGSQTAPVSGSLTATIAVGATEGAFGWVSPSGEPNVADWPTAAAASSDYSVVVDVSSIGANLSLVDGGLDVGSHIYVFNDPPTSFWSRNPVVWSSTTGTGTKTTTMQSESFALEEPASKLIGCQVAVNHNGT